MRGYRFNPGRLGNCVELRADAPGSIIKDGSNIVTTWNDISPNGYNATQPSDDLKPLYVTNALGGKPGIQFNGTSNYLTMGDKPPFGSDGHTIYVVGEYSGAQQVYIGKYSNGTNGCFYLASRDNNEFWYSTVDNTNTRRDCIAEGMVTGSPQIITARYSPTSADLFVEGVLQQSIPTTGAPLKTTVQPIALGIITSQPWYLGGRLFHVIIVFSPHTDTQVATMVQFLKTNWAQ